MDRLTVHCPATGPSRVVRSLFGPWDLDSPGARRATATAVLRTLPWPAPGGVFAALADGDYDAARALAGRPSVTSSPLEA